MWDLDVTWGAAEEDEAEWRCVFQGLAVRLGDVASLVCPVCGKAFGGRNRRQILERHIAIHTGHKPYTCPHCVFRSSRQDTLKIHVARIHKDLVASGGSGGLRDVGVREAQIRMRGSGSPRAIRDLVIYERSALLHEAALQQREAVQLGEVAHQESGAPNVSVNLHPSGPTIWEEIIKLFQNQLFFSFWQL